jgi:hypothetical protein
MWAPAGELAVGAGRATYRAGVAPVSPGETALHRRGCAPLTHPEPAAPLRSRPECCICSDGAGKGQAIADRGGRATNGRMACDSWRQ